MIYFILLGIIQGITEFLPVSSSGHLVFFNNFFKVESSNFLFVSIILHFATLVSVCIVYHKQIFELIKKPFSKTSVALMISTICSAIIVLLFKDVVVSAFSGAYLAFCFLITAIIMLVVYIVSKKANSTQTQITAKQAVIIGLMQGLAVFPGISRSGTTIATAIILGINSSEATNYSFILSVPIILGSLIFEIFDAFSSKTALYTGSVINLCAGFVTAVVFGLLAIGFMKKIAKTKRYYLFSIYLVIVAIFAFLIL